MLIEVTHHALSLRPNEALLDAYCEGRLHARLIIEAWHPARSISVITLPAQEFDAL
jgi:hypothetical protein